VYTDHFSSFPLIFSFYASRLALCRLISKHATRAASNMTKVGPKYSGSMSNSFQCIRTTIASSLRRNYNLMKIVTRRRLNGPGVGRLGPVFVSQRTYFARAVPFRDASCATFFHGAPKLRELGGGTGPDAGILTTAVHDEVSRSRFLERGASSRSAREERGPSSRVSRRTMMGKERVDATLSP
jgi:hypothetical protein